MNARTKIISLFCGLLFCAAPLLAGGPQQWSKAFSGEKVMNVKGNIFEFIVFKNCTAPGPKKAAPVSKLTVFDDLPDEPNLDDADSLRGELQHLQETKDYYLEMVKGTQEKIKELGESGAGEKEFLLEDIKVSEAMIVEINKSIEEIEGKIADLENAGSAAEKKEGDETAEKEEVKEKKDEDAKPAKGKDGKGTKKGKGDKPAPKAPVTHEELTTNYYDVAGLMNTGEEAFRNMLGTLGTDLTWDIVQTKVYLVTSPKMWQALKMPERIVQPARNVCWDSKQRAILLFASPAITNQLGKTFGYAVASMAFDLSLAKINPGGEVCNFISDGLAARASGLNCIVDVNKVHKFGRLKERDLLLLTELLNPTRMKDNKRCYYFMAQSKAFVDYYADKNMVDFRRYLEQAKGGNANFRNSFQFMHISDHWGLDYDSFCNELPKRVFFPITVEAETDPNAMDAWNNELESKDQALDKKKDDMQKRKEVREIRRKVGDEIYRKRYKQK